MTESVLFTWTVVIPVKVLARAKSRLAVLAGSRRGELALALATDTVAAVLACREVSHVLVVTDDAVAGEALSVLGACVIPDEPGDGLNAALTYGASVAGRRWPEAGIAALSADLPALRPGELGRALRAASAWPSAFVPDAQGSGTTLYAAAPGVAFAPRFGVRSRALHASGGTVELDLADVPGLRRDVDTPADLREVVTLGAGARTAMVAGELLG